MKILSPDDLSMGILVILPPFLKMIKVEIWFDNSHPGKKKFFDPLRKQFLIPDTSHQMRQILCQNNFFKIEFVRNLHKNLPHVWLGQVKAGGEDLNSKTENMSANKSGFQIL